MASSHQLLGRGCGAVPAAGLPQGRGGEEREGLPAVPDSTLKPLPVKAHPCPSLALTHAQDPAGCTCRHAFTRRPLTASRTFCCHLAVLGNTLTRRASVCVLGFGPRREVVEAKDMFTQNCNGPATLPPDKAVPGYTPAHGEQGPISCLPRSGDDLPSGQKYLCFNWHCVQLSGV